MIAELMDRIATVLEAMDVDDSRVANRLRYVPTVALEGYSEALPELFRNFGFGLDVTVSPDLLHEAPGQQPQHWTVTFPLAVYYPLGLVREQYNILRGMAADDAVRIIREIPRRLALVLTDSPVSGLTLIGAKAEHDGFEIDEENVIASAFTVTARFGRSF